MEVCERDRLTKPCQRSQRVSTRMPQMPRCHGYGNTQGRCNYSAHHPTGAPCVNCDTVTRPAYHIVNRCWLCWNPLATDQSRAIAHERVVADWAQLAIEERDAIAERHRLAGAGDCVGISDDLWANHWLELARATPDRTVAFPHPDDHVVLTGTDDSTWRRLRVARYQQGLPV